MILSSEISRQLAGKCRDVCEMLLPNGRRESGEWCVGSVDGESGKSLKVRLDGSKAGVWSDFQSGESGDLLDLWQSVRGIGHSDARAQACEFLGISTPKFMAPAREYSAPIVPKSTRRVENSLSAWEYLTGERKLSAEALSAYKVAATDDAIVFPFLVNDERVMVKTLAVKRENGKKKILPTSAGQKPVLFGWQAIPDTARSVAICEGELDAISLWQYGFPALSVPFGGGVGAKHEWVEHEYERLLQFDVIFLAMDQDDAGEAATQELIGRLGNHRCQVVKLPRKDANQCLQDGVGREQVARCFLYAKRQDPDELKAADAYRGDVMRLLFQPEDERGFSLPWRKLEQFKLRPGELSIWNGINGHGKSWMTSQVALEAIRHGEKVCVASMEFRPERYLRRMVLQSSGLTTGSPTQPFAEAIMDWMRGHLWMFAVTGKAKTERLLQCFEYAYRAYGCRFFVIDPLAKCGIGLEDYQAQKDFVEQLCDFKNEHDVHIALVTHPRKARDEMSPPDKMDVGGSGAITDLADSVVAVWRNKRKEEAMQSGDAEKIAKHEKSGDSLLIVQKQRNGEWEGKCALWHRELCNQWVGGPDARAFQYVRLRDAEAA